MRPLFLLSLLILGCNSAAPPAKTNSNPVAATPVVERIEVVRQGGHLGYHATCRITPDSVVHQLLVGTDSTKNTYFARATGEGEWKMLLQNMDLKAFGAAQNGESRMPVDGTDTEVSITSNGETISRTNAQSNDVWSRIKIWSEERCME
jgi:hypothetical protein